VAEGFLEWTSNCREGLHPVLQRRILRFLRAYHGCTVPPFQGDTDANPGQRQRLSIHSGDTGC